MTPREIDLPILFWVMLNLKSNLKLKASKHFKENSFINSLHCRFVKFQDAKKAQLDPNLAKDLRQSHFRFNEPMKYESYSHSMHKDILDKAKEINPKGKMKDLADDLRKNHFEYGNESGQFKTSQRDAYRGLHGKSSTLERELANDLRRNHFDVGEKGPFWKDTTYRVNFTWKDPQDD